MPKVSLMTFSLPLVTHFLASGPFVTAMPNTVASHHPARDLLSVLPAVGIPASPWPVVIVTLKDRTLSPIVERFIECAREIAQTFSAEQRSRQMTGRRS
jgi:DNA-binding transcriptional LysR family regulator